MRAVTIVHHRVADYDAWKQVYDSVGDMQRARRRGRAGGGALAGRV